MKNLALKRIREMEAYSPPLSGRRAFDGLLLDFNERTTPPTKKIKKAIEKLLKTNSLQIYPEYGELEKKLAKYAGVKTNQLLITNGSDNAIDIVFRTFTESNDKVIIPSPSFAMFYQSAQIAGNKILYAYYKKEDLSFPLRKILDLIIERVKLIVICNPNNPTGTLVPVEDIERIAKKVPNTILLVDEAYFEYSGVTAVSLIEKYSNIIVIRTLSKAFGLSSLRLGYLISSKININELLKVRGPYEVNMVAYHTALLSLDDISMTRNYADEIMLKAKPMVEMFFAKNKITFFQSKANFLLYKPFSKMDEKILNENGILVRPQNKTNIEETIRVSIGTVEQMKKFIEIYTDKILK